MFKAIKEFFFGKPVEAQPSVVAAPYKVEEPVSVPLVSQPLQTTNLLYTPEVSPVAEAAPKPRAKKPAEVKPVAAKKPAAPRKPRAKKTTA